MNQNNLKTAKNVVKKGLFKKGRIIEWYGGVDYENLSKVSSEIKKLIAEDSESEITLVINSFGGVTGIGMTFYDSIRLILKPNLCTIGSGDVDSSGILIFLAGQKRFLTKNTTMLFHLAGRTFDRAKRFSTADMENFLKEDKLKDYQYACLVADASGGKLSTEKVLKMMEKNTVITADEAVNLGLAHKIVSNSTGLQGSKNLY